VLSTGKYSNYYKSVTSIYKSTDYEDDMAMGAFWIYRATGDRSYLQAAVNYWSAKDWDVTSDWDNSGASVAVALNNLISDGISVPQATKITQFVTKTFLEAWTQSDGALSCQLMAVL